MDWPSHGSFYSGIVYARAEYKRAECAHSGLRKKMVSFAEKSGKTAGKSGLRTKSTHVDPARV